MVVAWCGVVTWALQVMSVATMSKDELRTFKHAKEVCTNAVRVRACVCMCACAFGCGAIINSLLCSNTRG